MKYYRLKVVYQWYLYLNRQYFDVHAGKVVTVETVLQLKRFCRRKKVQDFFSLLTRGRPNLNPLFAGFQI